MTKTVRIYGVDVEFTDKAPTVDGVYYALIESGWHISIIEGGLTSGMEAPSSKSWLWSAPLIPSDRVTKAYNFLEEIVSCQFYQRTCRGGEMERLMNQAIEALGGNQ